MKNLTLIIEDRYTGNALPGATVSVTGGNTYSKYADYAGTVILNLENSDVATITHVGYIPLKIAAPKFLIGENIVLLDRDEQAETLPGVTVTAEKKNNQSWWVWAFAGLFALLILKKR